MNAKDGLKGLGLGALVVLLSLISLAITAVVVMAVLYGGTIASAKLLPLFSVLTLIAIGLVVLVFLPLAVPRTTRGFASVAIFISSYVFGITLWMLGFLLTLYVWGVRGVIFGLVMGGVGVVPVAMAATLIKGMWLNLIELVFLALMMLATRFGAIILGEIVP